MIFACDYCHFLFSRGCQPEQCPDCGKYTVRQANFGEEAEFEARLKEFRKKSYADDKGNGSKS